MSKFAITGGRRLKGELCPQGAKNEALQVICACLLTKEEVPYPMSLRFWMF